MLKRFLPIVAVVLMAAGVTFADGIDGHIVVGSSAGHSGSCTGFESSADENGVVDTDCKVDAGGFVIAITFSVLDADTDGGLSLSPDTTLPGWTPPSCVSENPGGTDTCTIDAAGTYAQQLQSEQFFAAYFAANPPPTDGSSPAICDDSYLLAYGIPGGCDVTFSTNADLTQLFADNAPFSVTVQNLAEPGTLSMLMLGLLALLFVTRRKFVQSQA